MFLNSWPNRQRGQLPPAETAPNYFDFALSPTPVYKKGSGPPLSLPTPTAGRENQDGTIIEFIPGSADGEPKFLVGSTTQPGLRVTVNVIDIMDWVSARTFEEWNFQRSKEERRKERLEGLHWKARQKLEQARDQDRSELGAEGQKRDGRMGGQIEGGQGGIVKKRGRPFGSVNKKTALVEQVSPGRTRRRISSLIETAASQPSLTSPPKQHRGLAELVINDSSEELDLKDELGLNEEVEFSEDIEMIDEDTQLALQLQFNENLPTTSRSSTDPLGIYNDDDTDDMPSLSKAGVARPTSKSPTSSKKTPTQPRINANAFFIPSQRLFAKAKKSPPSKKAPAPPPAPINLAEDDENSEEDEDESEWEVESILNHEVRTDDDGFNKIYYKLAWKGDYEPTWEPRENVSTEMVKEYHATIKAKLVADDVSGKMKRLEDKKRKRQEEERKEKEKVRQKRRSTRSISRATTAETEEGRARKRPSRSPAVSYTYHDNENLFGSDDDDDDDLDMPDVRPRSKSNTKSRSGTASREGTASSGLFVVERVAPVANMFGPLAQPTPKVNGTAAIDIKGKGKAVIRNTIELDSSPARPAKSASPVNKGQIGNGKGKVIEISSGEESSFEGEEEDDELA